MKKLTEKGIALRKKFRTIQYISIGFLVVGAMSFVFLHNVPLMIAIVVVGFLVEGKLYRCPHCNKTLDCRRGIPEDAVCHHCHKYIFHGLD